MLKKLIKTILWYLRGGYKPDAFWNNWADTFSQDPWQRATHTQHTWMLKKIQASQPTSLLEVGCGFGRNIKFFIDNGINPAIITGVDISPKMIQQAKKYVNNSRVHLKIARAEKLPFKDKAFDIVVVHGVFMHIAGKNVLGALQETLRVARKSLIVVEQNYEADNLYTFVHNYPALLKELPAHLAEYKHNKKLGLDLIYAKVR